MSVAALVSGFRVAVLGLLLTCMTPAWGQSPTATPVVPAHGSAHAAKVVQPGGVGPGSAAQPGSVSQPGKVAQHAGSAPPHSNVLPLPPPPAPPAPPVASAAANSSPAAGSKPTPPAQDPNKGTNSGLPIPRFVSLRAGKVNLRSGPGERYQIDWVYQRRDLPVEIEREFDIWRLIRDADGVRGWVQEVMIMGRRSFEVTGEDRTLRSDPAETSRAVAVLKVGVIGRIRTCAAKVDWCQVQVADYRGWLRREEFWGTLPDEAVGN